MDVIIFGGDHLGNIPHLLHNHGVQLVKHVTGRKQADLRFDIPPKISAILVLTDYLSHSMLIEVKANAKRQGVKLVFAKRSWSQISKAINQHLGV